MSTTLIYPVYKEETSSTITYSDSLTKAILVSSLSLVLFPASNMKYKAAMDFPNKSIATVLHDINPMAESNLVLFDSNMNEEEDLDFTNISLDLKPVRSYEIKAKITTIEQGKPSFGGLEDFLS
jgi:hypothetical protein